MRVTVFVDGCVRRCCCSLSVLCVRCCSVVVAVCGCRYVWLSLCVFAVVCL